MLGFVGTERMSLWVLLVGRASAPIGTLEKGK